MPTTRKFVINCPSNEFCQELLNMLLENLPSYNIYYRVRNSKIEITVTGLKSDVNYVWSMIKTYRQLLATIYGKDKEGLINLPIKYIVMNTRKTFPPDVLVTLLTLRGYKAFLEDDIIKTNAGKEEVFELARMIADILQELRYRALGKSTKKIIAVASILLNKPVDEAIELLKEINIIEEEEEDKYRIKVNFDQALSAILRQYINTKGKDRGLEG